MEFKKLIMLFAVLFILPLSAFADGHGSHEDEVEDLTANEAKVFAEKQGAQYKYLQLERAIYVQIKSMGLIIDEVSSNEDVDNDRLEEILSEVSSLYDRVSSVNFENSSREELIENYVSYRKEAKDLGKEFRNLTKDYLSEEQKTALKEGIKEQREAAKEEFDQRMSDLKNKVKLEAVSRFLENSGLNVEEYVSKFEAGEISFEELRKLVKEDIGAMSEEERKALREDYKQKREEFREELKQEREKLRETVKEKREELREEVKAEAKEKRVEAGRDFLVDNLDQMKEIYSTLPTEMQDKVDGFVGFDFSEVDKDKINALSEDELKRILNAVKVKGKVYSSQIANRVEVREEIKQKREDRREALKDKREEKREDLKEKREERKEELAEKREAMRVEAGMKTQVTAGDTKVVVGEGKTSVSTDGVEIEVEEEEEEEEHDDMEEDDDHDDDEEENEDDDSMEVMN